MDDLVPPTPPSTKQDKAMHVITSSVVEPEVKKTRKGIFSIFDKKKRMPAPSSEPIEKAAVVASEKAPEAKTEEHAFEMPRENSVSDEDLDEIRRALGISGNPSQETPKKAEQKEEHAPGEDLSDVRKALGLKSKSKQQKQAEPEQKEEPEQFEVPEIEEEKDVSKEYDWTSHDAEESIADKAGFTEEPEAPAAEELPEEDKEEINEAIKAITEDVEVTKEEPEEYFSSMEQELKETKTQAVTQAKTVAEKPLADTTKLAKIRKILNDYEKRIDSKIRSVTMKLAAEKRDVSKQRSALEEKNAKFSAKEKEIKEKEQRLMALRQETSKLREESQSVKRQINSDRQEAESAEGELLTLRQQLKQNRKSFEEKDLMYKERLSELDKLAKKAEREYNSVQQRTAGLLARLKSREEAIAAKEKEFRALVEEERRIFDYIQKGNPESESFIKQVLKAEPVRQDVVPRQAQMGVSDDDSEERTIEEKIDDCKQILSEDNVDDAKLLYNEIRQEFVSGTLSEFEKARVQHEIKELYEEISAKMMQKI